MKTRPNRTQLFALCLGMLGLLVTGSPVFGQSSELAQRGEAVSPA